MKRFIDIGANLTDPQFRGIYRSKPRHSDDLSDVIARAKEAHVSEILVTGASLDESKEALALCRQYPGYLYSTVGVHPSSSGVIPEEPEARQKYLSDLESLAIEGQREGHVKAFGEIGLDYDRLYNSTVEIQQRAFADQLEVAARLKLPLFLHSRNCAQDFHRMIQPYTQQLKGVVHSFTGSADEMRDLLSLGLYIGINGCSLKTEENLAVVAQIPLDRLLLETDGPWCEIRRSHASFKYTTPLKYEFAKSPEKWARGKLVRGRCEPCEIGSVAEVVAAVHDVKEETVVSAALENTLELFGFAK